MGAGASSSKQKSSKSKKKNQISPSPTERRPSGPSQGTSARRISSKIQKIAKLKATRGPAEEGSATKILFDALDKDGSGHISSKFFKELLEYNGIAIDDYRLTHFKSTLAKLDALETDKPLTQEQFEEAILTCSSLIHKAVTGALTVPDFQHVCHLADDVYKTVLENRDGANASYIPQLAEVDPEQFAISITTVDGQHYSTKDADKSFCIQSCSKPISYLIGLNLHGHEKVHHCVGTEPSGHPFNEMVLKDAPSDDNPGRKIPHNPMINAGAIMAVTFLYPDLPMEERLEKVIETWRRISGDKPEDVGYDEKTYESERATAYRNWCLGYMMREKDAFPDCFTNLSDNLELYFQICSLTSTNRAMSQMAATLANGGVNPLTGERTFEADQVRCVLPIMLSSGMYDYSGQWAFDVGVPAKSGVGGCVFMVVPNVMGISIWSPRLDKNGNSVRGVDVAKRLQERMQFHNFEVFSGLSRPKFDPTKRRDDDRLHALAEVLFAVKESDVTSVQLHHTTGVNIFDADYDNRNVFHVAASEKNEFMLSFLVELLYKDFEGDKKKMLAILNKTDRWGSTPLSDCRDSEECCAVLKKEGAVDGAHIPLIELDINQTGESNTDAIYAAANGNLFRMIAICATGESITNADYDGRTALHLAASNGHDSIIKYLLHQGRNAIHALLYTKDRWGNTPLDDAKREGHNSSADILQQAQDEVTKVD